MNLLHVTMGAALYENHLVKYSFLCSESSSFLHRPPSLRSKELPLNPFPR
jgi:hypothetical protein